MNENDPIKREDGDVDVIFYVKYPNDERGGPTVPGMVDPYVESLMLPLLDMTPEGVLEMAQIAVELDEKYTATAYDPLDVVATAVAEPAERTVTVLWESDGPEDTYNLGKIIEKVRDDFEDGESSGR